jgi:hypothetical protein
VLLALIIIALWVAILAPGVVRWVREHQPTTSIASFHRQLRLLEGSGPKLVEPAYRLGGGEPAPSTWEAPVPERPAPRLTLVPTGATDKEPQMRYDDHYEDDEWDQWEETHAPAHARRTVRVPSAYDELDDDYRPSRRSHDVVLSPDGARVRRTRILVGIGGTIGATFLLGLLPGMTFLWAVTLLAVVALVGYLGLMFYAANSGLYGNESVQQPTRIARVVVPTHDEYDDYAMDDDGWDTGRVAAAR